MAGQAPTNQSSTVMQRLYRLRKLRNLQLALDLMGSQPQIPESPQMETTAQEYRMEIEHADLLEEDGGGGGGWGGAGQYQQATDAMNSSYALRAARMTPIAPPISPPETVSENSGMSEDAGTQETDPMQDPVYRLKQDLHEARQAELATAETSAVDQTVLGAVSKYSDGAWLSWMWASIPGIPANFGFTFVLATVASWVALLKTILGSMFVKILGANGAKLLPPEFSFLPLTSTRVEGKKIWSISSGISSFAFFVTAHVIWLFIAICIVLAIIQLYLLVAPYIEAASFVCRYITIHPLCLIAPK